MEVAVDPADLGERPRPAVAECAMRRRPSVEVTEFVEEAIETGNCEAKAYARNAVFHAVMPFAVGGGVEVAEHARVADRLLKGAFAYPVEELHAYVGVEARPG